MDVHGELDFDSYMEFWVQVSSSTSVSVADIRLVVTHPEAPFGMAGMGRSGGAYMDTEWRWNATEGNPFVWLGRPEAGIFLKLKGWVRANRFNPNPLTLTTLILTLDLSTLTLTLTLLSSLPQS